jgi:hypothetical protein
MTPTTTRSATTPCCAQTGFAERPRFFPRQLITPDDLTLAQDYFRNKLRRHNRYLHGWGIVCGAKVVATVDNLPWMVVIKSGYILGPYGDEILIDQDLCFDVRTRCMTGVTGDACSGAVAVSDPMCSGTTSQVPPGPLFIAVRYKETMAKPVRVQPVGCGCDDSSCEYSRWQDGYEICVLDSCPASHKTPPDTSTIATAHPIPDCPPCPTDPWVVLGTVTVDDKGLVQTVDNCSCRRLVIGLAPYWLNCKEPAVSTAPTPPNPTPAPVNTTPGGRVR